MHRGNGRQSCGRAFLNIGHVTVLAYFPDGSRREEATESSGLGTPHFVASTGGSSLWERYGQDAPVDSSVDSQLDSPTAEFPLDVPRTGRWAKYMPQKVCALTLRPIPPAINNCLDVP